jgi:micrococcal nuclease
MGGVGKTILLVVALAVVGTTCQKSSEAAAPGQATVTRVVDGDTLHVRIGGADDKVRLVGIDTPETHGPGGLRECFGQEATRHMEDLLPVGTAVTVVRDVEARDRYGRLLAYIYRARDGLFVNLAMAREGYAVPLTIAPNVAHAAEFVAAASDARRANRGLWPACGGADKRIP